MMKMKFIFLISLFFLCFYFFTTQESKKLIHKYSQQSNRHNGLKKKSKLIKSTKMNKPIRQRTLGSRVHSKRNRDGKKKFWFEGIPTFQNDVWRKKGLRQLLGVFATHRDLPNRKLIKRIRGHNIYERSSIELENVFVNDNTSDLKFWSGEVLIKASKNIIFEVNQLPGITVVKELNSYLLIRIDQASDYLESIKKLDTMNGVKSIELDLRSQRRSKI
jgi:hypothetical protein